MKQVLDVVTGLNKSITDRDIIVSLINNFLGPNFDEVCTNLLIARAMVYFGETGHYPNNFELQRMIYKLEMEAFEKRL